MTRPVTFVSLLCLYLDFIYGLKPIYLYLRLKVSTFQLIIVSVSQSNAGLQEGFLSGWSNFCVKIGDRRDKIRINFSLFITLFADSTNTWKSTMGTLFNFFCSKKKLSLKNRATIIMVQLLIHNDKRLYESLNFFSFKLN